MDPVELAAFVRRWMIVGAILYAGMFVVSWIAGVLRERVERRRFDLLRGEIARASEIISREGDRLRAFLDSQEARRLRSRGREARFRLHLEPEQARDRILVGRILDAGATEDDDAEIDAALKEMTGDPTPEKENAGG